MGGTRGYGQETPNGGDFRGAHCAPEEDDAVARWPLFRQSSQYTRPLEGELHAQRLDFACVP